MGKMSFEKALSELEGTVEKLDKGDLPLEESLALFETGVKLAKYLRQELEQAEKKIEILLKDEDGELKVEPFDVTSDKEPSEGSQEPESGENNNLPF